MGQPAATAANPDQRLSQECAARRIWQLRDNLTAYDASYVALAESLGCALVTADARLSRAGGASLPDHCRTPLTADLGGAESALWRSC